jgi:NAD(P)-dependent dehydrogenase (short-subunit alcohol dehydrogenase family)
VTAVRNRHVLVTGGASGIGRLLVLGCASPGATVTVWDLDAARAETSSGWTTRWTRSRGWRRRTTPAGSR